MPGTVAGTGTPKAGQLSFVVVVSPALLKPIVCEHQTG